MKKLLNIDKKTTLYIAIGVAVVGGAGYFFLRKSEKEKAENTEGKQAPTTTLENGVKVNADLKTDYGKKLESWVKNNKQDRLNLVTSLLTEMAKTKGSKNAYNLIVENLPDDEYMKVFKHTFYFHIYTEEPKWYEYIFQSFTAIPKPVMAKVKNWDLKSWIENRLTSEQVTNLKDRYPSLKNHLKK